MLITQMIKQIWVEYHLWEDYAYGFYNTNCHNEEVKILESVSFMKNHNLFKLGMEKSVAEWGNSMLNNLTNPSMNKIAYIGQCSNCFINKTPSFVTKKAWRYLSDRDMEINNINALNVFESWKRVFYPKLINMRRSGLIDATQMGYQTKLNLQ